MSASPVWERLTAIATLGTARAGARTDESRTEELWPDPTVIVTGSQEQSLLRAAAATHLWLQAGQRVMARAAGNVPDSPPDSPADNPVVADETPQLREIAAWRLGRMLNGEHGSLLEEWLELASRSGRILPPHWVPVVLQHASPALCLRYSNMLGRSAGWLAQRNPAWADRIQPPEPSQEHWNAGTLAERCVQLRLVCARDAAEGLAWLQSTWGADPPEAREAFLKVLQPTVCARDEAFLEAALDDKRKAVRQAAAESLAGLAGSAYLQRAAARAESVLSWEGAGRGLTKLLRKPKLAVQLPAALDKPAQRDGIEAKPPTQRKIGERTFWMTQMLSLVPPVHWTQRFQCSAEDLLAAARATEFAQELLAAFSTAALRHPNGEWQDALCAGWIAAEQELQADALARLLAVTGEQQPALLLKYLRVLLPNRFDVALALLTRLEVRWSAAITQLVLDALREVVRQDKQQWSHARNTLASEARYCDVATARRQLPKLLDVCAEGSPWRNAVDAFQDVLEFRAAMQQELLS
jgi:hypothetical protein